MKSSTLPKPEESLAAYVQRLRLALGMSQRALAAKSGVHAQSIGKIEHSHTTVRLIDLQLREREKFRYDYDFFDNWTHQLRVEKIQYPEQPLAVPVCVAGKRSVPPENCGGPGPFSIKNRTTQLAMPTK